MVEEASCCGGCFSSDVTGKLNRLDGKREDVKHRSRKPMIFRERAETEEEVHLPAEQIKVLAEIQ